MERRRYRDLKSVIRAVGQIGLILFLFGNPTCVAAQVFSVNLIGYSSRPIHMVAPLTAAYISNPLNTIDNRLSTILRGVPDGTVLFLHRNGAFETYEYLGGGWDPEDAILHPGEGAILHLDRNAASNPTVLLVIGEVPQGTLVNPIPPGESLRASKAPIAGPITTQLGLNPRDSDVLYLFNETTQTEEVYVYFLDFGWDPSEPFLRVGQSFRYLNASGTVNNWTQTFHPLLYRASDKMPAAPSSIYTPPSASLLCPAGPARLSIRRNPSQVQITWQVPLDDSQRPIEDYRLESRSNLVTGVWSQIAGPQPVTLPTSNAHSFFRLSAIPQNSNPPKLFFKTCVASALGLYWHRTFTGYRVEQTDSLLSPSWTPVPQSRVDTNGFWQVGVPIEVALRFFRLTP